MEKYVFAVLLLLSLASAVSQQEAGIICNPYSSEGETIQITGPISCETQYWNCEFYYYGNEQNVVLAIEKTTGAVLGKNDEILDDVLTTKYAVDSGASYLFETFLSDSTFVIDMNAMNVTLLDYGNILKVLERDNDIDDETYINFNEKIENVQKLSSELSGRSKELFNLSENFWESPDCNELIAYLDEFNQTLILAENFSMAWNDFINRYNALAANVDTYIATINPSNAQQMQQGIQLIIEGLVSYREDSEEYKTTVLGNMESRYDRKDAKDKLDAAYEIVKNSLNPDATSKYNEASRAYANGDYVKTRSLSADAISLAGIVPDTDNTPTIIIKEAPDYTPYILLVVILMAAILYITFKKKKVEEEEKKEEKPVKKGGWGWSNEKQNSMEKKASDGLLDS
jgi:hypothetical protein